MTLSAWFWYRHRQHLHLYFIIMLKNERGPCNLTPFQNEIVANFILPFHHLETPRLIQFIYYQFVSLSTFIYRDIIRIAN